MFVPVELWHTALRILATHGALAERHVLDRIRELCVRNDFSGVSAWSKILVVINELRRAEPQDREREH